VVLLVLFGISGTQTIWAQEFSNVSRMEQSLENMSSQMEEVVERLTMMNDRFGALKQVQEITVYLFVIVFMMGLALCDFWVLHWSGTQTVPLYKETLFGFVPCSCYPRYDNNYTIHGEQYIIWRNK
jgi:hypothetical protein